MTETALDLYYIRTTGEGIRARLFPVPKADGRQSYPPPIGVHYRPDDDTDEEVLFILERTIDWIEPFAEDVPAFKVRVVLEDDTFVTDLTFEREPSVTLPDLEWLTALLRAIAGVL